MMKLSPRLMLLLGLFLVLSTSFAQDRILDEKQVQQSGNWNVIAFSENGNFSHVMIENRQSTLRYFPMSNRLMFFDNDAMGHIGRLPDAVGFVEVWFEGATPSSTSSRVSCFANLGEGNLTNGQDAYVNIGVPEEMDLGHFFTSSTKLNVLVGQKKLLSFDLMGSSESYKAAKDFEKGGGRAAMAPTSSPQGSAATGGLNQWTISEMRDGGNLRFAVAQSPHSPQLTMALSEETFLLEFFDDGSVGANPNMERQPVRIFFEVGGQGMAGFDAEAEFRSSVTGAQDATLAIDFFNLDVPFWDLIQKASKFHVQFGRTMSSFNLSGSSAAYKGIQKMIEGGGIAATQPSRPGMKLPTPVSAPDPGPGFDRVGPEERDSQIVGFFQKWKIASVYNNGRYHSSMAQSQQDPFLTYFIGPAVHAIEMFHDPQLGTEAQTGSVPVRLFFEGDTAYPPMDLTATFPSSYGSSQDATVRIDVSSVNDFALTFASCTKVNVQFGRTITTFDIAGSKPAVDAILNMNLQSAAKGAQSGPMNRGPNPPAQGGVPDRIVAAENPAANWEVDLPPGGSRSFKIAVKQGNTLSLQYLEDTKQGTVDLEKYSLEEGLDNGIRLPISETRDYELFLQNPTNRPLAFTVYMDVK